MVSVCFYAIFILEPNKKPENCFVQEFLKQQEGERPADESLLPLFWGLEGFGGDLQVLSLCGYIYIYIYIKPNAKGGLHGYVRVASLVSFFFSWSVKLWKGSFASRSSWALDGFWYRISLDLKSRNLASQEHLQNMMAHSFPEQGSHPRSGQWARSAVAATPRGAGWVWNGWNMCFKCFWGWT